MICCPRLHKVCLFIHQHSRSLALLLLIFNSILSAILCLVMLWCALRHFLNFTICILNHLLLCDFYLFCTVFWMCEFYLFCTICDCVSFCLYFVLCSLALCVWFYFCVSLVWIEWIVYCAFLVNVCISVTCSICKKCS